jgi:hypothetical protein
MEKYKNILFAIVIFSSGFTAPYIYIKVNSLVLNSFEFGWFSLMLTGSYAVIVLSLNITALNIEGPKISTEEQDERLREGIRYYLKIIKPHVFTLSAILLLYCVVSLLIDFRVIPAFTF